MSANRNGAAGYKLMRLSHEHIPGRSAVETALNVELVALSKKRAQAPSPAGVQPIVTEGVVVRSHGFECLGQWGRQYRRRGRAIAPSSRRHR